jgi:hypothetical protein
MIPKSSAKSEQAFGKLTDNGYSERVAELIWRWYHPNNKETIYA